MAGVAMIYAVRALMSVTALKLYVLGLSFAGIVAFVSVSHVVQNFEHVAAGGPPSITLFIVSAVLSTTIVVQLALALATVSLVSLVAPAIRSVATRVTFA